MELVMTHTVHTYVTFKRGKATGTAGMLMKFLVGKMVMQWNVLFIFISSNRATCP